MQARLRRVGLACHHSRKANVFLWPPRRGTARDTLLCVLPAVRTARTEKGLRRIRRQAAGGGRWAAAVEGGVRVDRERER